MCVFVSVCKGGGVGVGLRGVLGEGRETVKSRPP